MDDHHLHQIALDGTVGTAIMDHDSADHGVHSFADLDEVALQNGGHYQQTSPYHPRVPQHRHDQDLHHEGNPFHYQPNFTSVLPSLPNLGSQASPAPLSPQGYLSPSSSSDPSTPTRSKKKRKRQMKTPAQLTLLEKEFSITPLPNKETRYAIANAINLTPRQVQIWFQNKRAKVKNQRRKVNPNFSFQASSVLHSPPTGPTNVSKELQQLMQNAAPILESHPHHPALSGLQGLNSSDSGTYPEAGLGVGTSPNILDLGEGKKVSSKNSWSAMSQDSPMDSMKEKSVKLPHPHPISANGHSPDKHSSVPMKKQKIEDHHQNGLLDMSFSSQQQNTQPLLSNEAVQDMIDAINFRVSKLCKQTKKVKSENGDNWEDEIVAIGDKLELEIHNIRDKIKPFIAVKIDDPFTDLDSLGATSSEDHMHQNRKRKFGELSESQGQELIFYESCYTICFRLLMAFTECFMKTFLDDPTRGKISETKYKVENLIFNFWNEIFLKFESVMTRAAKERWLEEIVKLDQKGNFNIEISEELKEIEVEKRFFTFNKSINYESYTVLSRKINLLTNIPKKEFIKTKTLELVDAKNYFEIRSQILLHEHMYDELIADVQNKKSSSFLRRKVIGQTDTHDKNLLVNHRSQYVMTRAKKELLKELQIVCDKFVFRCLIVSKIKDEWTSLEGNEDAGKEKYENIVNLLIESLKEENEKFGASIESDVNSEKSSRDFKWEKGEIVRPCGGFYNGIEGWFAIARAAFAVGFGDVGEEKFTEFCGEIEEQLKQKLKGNIILTKLLESLIDTSGLSVWQPLLEVLKKVESGDLYTVGSAAS